MSWWSRTAPKRTFGVNLDSVEATAAGKTTKTMIAKTPINEVWLIKNVKIYSPAAKNKFARAWFYATNGGSVSGITLPHDTSVYMFQYHGEVLVLPASTLIFGMMAQEASDIICKITYEVIR